MGVTGFLSLTIGCHIVPSCVPSHSLILPYLPVGDMQRNLSGFSLRLRVSPRGVSKEEEGNSYVRNAGTAIFRKCQYGTNNLTASPVSDT